MRGYSFGCTIALLLAAASAPAEEGWTPLAGEAAMAALSNHKLTYSNGATQTFSPSGDTQYNAGHLQPGRWRIEAAGYCSQWPPSDKWDCYGLEISTDGHKVRFISGDGSSTEGVY